MRDHSKLHGVVYGLVFVFDGLRMRLPSASPAGVSVAISCSTVSVGVLVFTFLGRPRLRLGLGGLVSMTTSSLHGYDESDEDGDDGSNDEAPFGASLDVGQSGKDEDRSSP